MTYLVTSAKLEGRKSVMVGNARTEQGLAPCEGLSAIPPNAGWGIGEGGIFHRAEFSREESSPFTRDETSKQLKRGLCLPALMVYERRIPFREASCKIKPQTYTQVDLSRPQRHGFQHVGLILGDLPCMSRDQKCTLLTLKPGKQADLGAVGTMVDVHGLIIHRVLGADSEVLETIMDMHTSLQVHPFVSRTFTLQMATVPFAGEKVPGFFVGEAVGEWNLGTRHRDMTLSATERATLAYRVTQCLLRVQILSLRVLGFTMKCIRPERIWRWGNGFRVDMLACLVDTVYTWSGTDPASLGEEGLATVRTTLVELDLFKCLPGELQQALNSPEGVLANSGTACDAPRNADPGDEYFLTRVYNLCMFTESATDTILGPGGYEGIKVDTLDRKVSAIEPYGPFCIALQTRPFKWNKAIIAEPVVHPTRADLDTRNTAQYHDV